MKILIERYRNKIHFYTPHYDEDVVTACKDLEGKAKFNNSSFECWTFPLDWQSCLDLRDVFGDMLTIGPRLTRWATVEAKRQKRARKISKLKAIDLDQVMAEAPALGAALQQRTYQQVGAAFIATTKAALLADEPGLGKTLQAMAAMIEANITGPILVLAPQTALEITWEEELHRWLPDDGVYTAVGDRAKRERVIRQCLDGPEKRRWLLANYEMLRIMDRLGTGPMYPLLMRTEWSSVVVDESQRLLICRTGAQYKWSLQRRGVAALRLASGAVKLAMSGTPNRGKTENLWGTLNWLFPDRYTSYTRWVDKWFAYLQDPVTSEMMLDDIAEDRKNAFYAELDTMIIRRTKAEVAPDMPPKMYAGWPLDAGDPHSPVGVWLPMTGKQAKAYDQMRKDGIAMLESGELMANGVLAEMTRLKQFAICYTRLETRTVRERNAQTGLMELQETTVAIPELPSNKAVWLEEFFAERGLEKGVATNTGKIIVASQFSKVCDLMEERFGKLFPVCKITGAITGTARKRAKELFQDPESGYNVIFLSTKAGGVSLTLDLADDVVFLDETFDPDDQIQVEDRAHRVSRPDHKVTITYVRTLGTIEEAIAADNATLADLQHELFDGRRGVAKATQLLNFKSRRK